MSDFHDDQELDPEQDGGNAIKQMRQRIKQLEAESKANQGAAARAAELERKLALTEMGANMKDPRAKYLPATDDFDQLREAAIDLGLIAPPEPDVPDAELAAHERIAGAASGGGTIPGGNTVAPEQFAGMTQQEVIAWAASQGKLEIQ